MDGTTILTNGSEKNFELSGGSAEKNKFDHFDRPRSSLRRLGWHLPVQKSSSDGHGGHDKGIPLRVENHWKVKKAEKYRPRSRVLSAQCNGGQHRNVPSSAVRKKG